MPNKNPPKGGFFLPTAFLFYSPKYASSRLEKAFLQGIFAISFLLGRKQGKLLYY
jgi:hypothetical protein